MLHPSLSFRGWLRTSVKHVCSDCMAGRRRSLGRLAQVGSDGVDLIQTAAAREDLGRRLEAEFDLELLEEAERRVRRRVARAHLGSLSADGARGALGRRGRRQAGHEGRGGFRLAEPRHEAASARGQGPGEPAWRRPAAVMRIVPWITVCRLIRWSGCWTSSSIPRAGDSGDHVEHARVCQERLGGLVATRHPAPARPPADAGDAPSASEDEFSARPDGAKTIKRAVSFGNGGLRLGRARARFRATRRPRRAFPAPAADRGLPDRPRDRPRRNGGGVRGDRIGTGPPRRAQGACPPKC